MKKVLLLGDSICSWYAPIVKELLKDICEVYKKDDNGRYAAYTLWQAEDMFEKYGSFDVVHWNNGYWDMSRWNNEPLYPLEAYIYFLKKIIELCRKNSAKIIFATTTPSLSSGCSEDNTGTGEILEYDNDRIIQYNNAAKLLMVREGITVNDLYTLCLEDEKFYKCEDGLHLTAEGNRRCAEQIATMICKSLNCQYISTNNFQLK